MLPGNNSLTLHPRITRHSSTHDTWRRYLTDAPSPAKIAQTLRAVDQGDVAAMVELTEEFEAKDAHLQGVAARRREAVTALDWSIIPDLSTQDDKEATEAAEYCQRTLERLSTWEDTLIHLESAIGPGVAVSELIWSRGVLAEIVDVSGHRLQSDPNKGGAIRIQTDEQVDGVPTYSPGFIVHTPKLAAGFPLRVTITRANAYLWIIKHFVLADWAAFSEVYGQPIRVATLPEEPGAAVTKIVTDMLKNMAADCWGVFPEGVEVKLLEAARSNQPYEAVIDWIERKQSILWLGQTLTTEPSTIGSLALGRVHDNVRASITLSDIKAERRTIRQQVLKPMINLRWPQERRPIPHFERTIIGDTNLDERRVRMDELRFAKEAGLTLETAWLYEELNIPIPRKTEESEP